MRLLRVLRMRLRSLFGRARAESDLERELAFHLEQLTRENIDNGMDPAEARRAATRTLGGTAQIEEECRDQRRVTSLVDIGKDLAYAWRALRASPGFTTLAVLNLALGLGASIAVYTLADAMLIGLMPFPEPNRLVALFSVHEKRGSMEAIGQADFRDWRAANHVFEHMAFTEFDQKTLTGLGDAERITGTAVSEGFFEMLGVQAQIGRCFTTEEEKPGADHVLVISHAFWMRRFGADPSIAGRSITLNDELYRITGVMPAGFRFNEGVIVDYWTPITYVNQGHANHQYAGYARLKPGVSMAAGQAEMTAIAARMAQAYPEDAGWTVHVASLRSSMLWDLGTALAVFAAAAGIVLLVACGNVASLLLARGIARRKEIAVRMALGAGRWPVVRLLLAESLLLSGVATLGGLVFAFWLVRISISAAPRWLELDALVTPHPGIALFAATLALFTTLLTGLWPALRTSLGNPQDDLKESGSAMVQNRAQGRSLNALVVMEIALAVVLLAFGGLLARSLAHLLNTNLGYRPDGLVTFRMSLPDSRYKDDAARVRFWTTLEERLSAIPGVMSVAAADGVPLGGTYSVSGIEIDGIAPPRDWTESVSRISTVTPSYFETVGIPLSAGQVFGSTDDPVVMVNQTFVRTYLRDRNPLGSRIRTRGRQWRQIVGVIGDSRYNGPTRPSEPETYVPFARTPILRFVAIRSSLPGASVLHSAQEALRDVDPSLPITEARTMREALHRATALPRALMTLVAAFAAATLGMAMLGLGGVMAYTVSRRRREFGLRMALGASSGDLSRGVLAQAGRMVVVGAIIGVAGTLAGSRMLESLLYGVEPRDPWVIAGAPLALGVIALLAAAVPARIAASVDPAQALRQE